MIDTTNFVDLTNIDPKTWNNYIGNGYRYCCYRTIGTGRRKTGQILLFGFDKNGMRTNFIIPHQSHLKYNVIYDTNEKDIYGKNVDTKYFPTTKERQKFIKHMTDGVKIVESLPPQNEFLHKMFDDVALDENFNQQTLRIQYFDIETEISDSFEFPKTARNRINMLTIYDTFTEKFYTWSLQKINIDFSDEYDENGNIINECHLKDTPKEKFVVFDDFQDDEQRMLLHFLNWFQNNYPDVLCGFNSQAYDVPYVVNRIERVLGNPENVDKFGELDENGVVRNKLSDITLRLSPVQNVRIRKNNLDNKRANKQAEIVADIDGIFLADELVLYRDKFEINQPLDGGNGLDNIGEVECGIHKIHYRGTKTKNGEQIHSLKDLYEKDWNRFYKYNVMDVEVLRKVEEKVKLIPLARSITSAGLSNYDAIYSSIGYLIGSLIMFAKTQMGTVFTSYKNKKFDSIPYEGAFVFPETMGIYKGGISTIDFNSLYPSSIRACNISNETYVGKISRFPIEDECSEFFTKESPIDIYGNDETVGLFETDSEKEYKMRYSKKLCNGVYDRDIEKFYFLPSNKSEKRIITRKQLDKLLETKCILTRNNTLFLKHSIKQGVVSGWCKHFYALRKSTKKLMEKLEMDLYNNVVPTEKIEETKIQIENLNGRQLAIKIALNSIYGCLSCSFSPIYNSYIGQSITRTGKNLNTSASHFIRKRFKELFGIDDKYTIVSSGDTDSCVSNSYVRVIR